MYELNNFSKNTVELFQKFRIELKKTDLLLN